MISGTGGPPGDPRTEYVTISRAVGAFEECPDALPVTGRRSGDPRRTEDMAEVMRAEIAAAKRVRPPA